MELINGMPKQIMCEGTLFTLGAIDENGDGYYLSANCGFIRASDMYVPDGVEIPRYEEYAINGLYFEYDMEGYLSDYVCEMLGSPKCTILTEEMQKFIRGEGINND